MPDKEIEECEMIISLCPDDHQALLRLGILYFRQGKNAKGLEVYERLKPIQPLLAEELIGHYGAYTSLFETKVAALASLEAVRTDDTHALQKKGCRNVSHSS
jgi:hypothetical protein